MELLKLVLVVAAVAISTFPRFSHSMIVFYPAGVSNDSIIIGVGLAKDGDYGKVCDEGDTDIVNFLCYNLGSVDSDSYINSSMLNGSLNFVNFSCPSGFSSCGDNASIVSNCSSPLILDCDFSGCFQGQVQLANSVNVSTDSGVALVGYPEVCVNGNFTPICNGTELGAIELILICAYQSINASTGLIGNPHNAGLSPLMPSAPSSVTGYDCDTMANCAVTTGMNCTSGYAIVTCEEGIPSSSACDPNAYVNGSILFNNETNVSADGSVVTTGIYQSCTDGSYVRYCTHPSQWSYPSLVDIANGICISLGYSFGVIVPFENRFYQDSPPGISAIDINCTSVEGSECNYTLCDDINRQMVLRCTRSPGCPVTGGYLRNNITRLSVELMGLI
uniref:SRCR domain-containing protein n=1 Tax=Amphimedon queenslandica TaxID=400682 RepID=A0A1X7SQI9_AMPQE